jgi:hypothetical protein
MTESTPHEFARRFFDTTKMINVFWCPRCLRLTIPLDRFQQQCSICLDTLPRDAIGRRFVAEERRAKYEPPKVIAEGILPDGTCTGCGLPPGHFPRHTIDCPEVLPELHKADPIIEEK